MGDTQWPNGHVHDLIERDPLDLAGELLLPALVGGASPLKTGSLAEVWPRVEHFE